MVIPVIGTLLPSDHALVTAIAKIPHFTASLSVLASSWIILEVLSDRKKQGRVYHRLVLCMSCFDVMKSFWLFLSTWPAPADSGIYGSSGNTATCSAQGFFLQLGIAVPVYNTFLSIYYLLLIRFNWTETHIQKKVEPWMHAVAITLAFGTAITGTVLELYNPHVWCWIAPLPLDCLQSFENHGVTNCIRGDNATIYTYAFFFAEVWAAILLATAALIVVYFSVRNQELRVERYRFGAVRNRKRSEQVFFLSALYIAAFLVTWIFPSIAVIGNIIREGSFAVIHVLIAIFFPFQGFFNFLIYIRPRYQKYRKLYPELSRIAVIRRVLGRTAVFWRPFNDDDHKYGTGSECEETSDSS